MAVQSGSGPIASDSAAGARSHAKAARSSSVAESAAPMGRETLLAGGLDSRSSPRASMSRASTGRLVSRTVQAWGMSAAGGPRRDALDPGLLTSRRWARSATQTRR